MDNNNNLTKALAISGTLLVGLPILAPILIGVIAWIATSKLHMDYLMPAELFLLVLIGGALLVWAAVRINSHIKWTGWSLSIATALLAATQGMAVLLGLANGDYPPEGWRFIIVISLLGLFNLAIVILAIGGIRLIVKTFKQGSITDAQGEEK